MSELDKVKVGDEVVLVRRNYSTQKTDGWLGVIERVTKTQVTAIGGRRFNKRTGVEIGSRASRFEARETLKIHTPELRAEIEESKAEKKAETKCRSWAETLTKARGQDAIRLAGMLPDAKTD